jgi:hypothetical protein
MPRWVRIMLILATVLWTLAGVASILALFFVPLLFDPPESSDDVFTVALAASIALFPFSCLLSIAGSWIAFVKRRRRASLLLASLPLLPIAVALLTMVGHEAFAGGRLGS